MKAYVSTALAAVLVLTLPACQKQTADSGAAESTEAGSVDALAGTWKVDLASLKFEGKPEEYLLKDGSWNCKTCIPPLTVAADGKVLTNKFKDMTTPGQTIEGSQTEQRVGPAPAGAHAVSGQWKPDRVGEYSEDALNLTYSVAGNSVTMNSAGQSYTAELGGPAVPIKGDAGGTMVKVSREGASGIRETNIRDGKEIGYAILTPSADGKTIGFTYTDIRDGSSVSWTGNKTS